MNITKDSVTARKNELDQQRLNLIANLNAVVGAQQDCEYWLQKLDEEELAAGAGAPPIDIIAEPVS
jgi:hypothetical protein